MKRSFLIGAVLLFFSVLLMSNVAFSAEIQVCRKLKQSFHVDKELSSAGVKRHVYCTVRPKVGKIGDFVEIKNRYNYIVAVGRIVEQTRVSSKVELVKYRSEIGSMSGFSAQIRVTESQDFWTATTAPF